MPNTKGATPRKAHILKRLFNPSIAWFGQWWPIVFLLAVIVFLAFYSA